MLRQKRSAVRLPEHTCLCPGAHTPAIQSLSLPECQRRRSVRIPKIIATRVESLVLCGPRNVERQNAFLRAQCRRERNKRKETCLRRTEKRKRKKSFRFSGSERETVSERKKEREREDASIASKRRRKPSTSRKSLILFGRADLRAENDPSPHCVHNARPISFPFLGGKDQGKVF